VVEQEQTEAAAPAQASADRAPGVPRAALAAAEPEPVEAPRTEPAPVRASEVVEAPAVETEVVAEGAGSIPGNAEAGASSPLAAAAGYLAASLQEPTLAPGREAPHMAEVREEARDARPSGRPSLQPPEGGAVEIPVGIGGSEPFGHHLSSGSGGAAGAIALLLLCVLPLLPRYGPGCWLLAFGEDLHVPLSLPDAFPERPG